MGKYRLNPRDNDNFIISENFDEIASEKITAQKYWSYVPSEHKKKL